MDALWEDDAEHLEFEQMETYPAQPVPHMRDAAVLAIIEQIRRFKHDFTEAAVRDEQSEMSRFWLRKTRQPVLAVLAVQKPQDAQPTYFRGANVEVSMPTGSLCAERNAVGTAIANDPSLRREHFKMVAVLFMGELDKRPKTPTSKGQGRAMQNLKRASSSSSVPFKEDTDDVNPRGPCGSCLEWLGKIAACNPSFKVITFSSRSLEEAIVRNLK